MLVSDRVLLAGHDKAPRLLVPIGRSPPSRLEKSKESGTGNGSIGKRLRRPTDFDQARMSARTNALCDHTTSPSGLQISASIACTIDFMRHPTARSRVPSLRILQSSSLPRSSTNVTPESLMVIVLAGLPSAAASQHFSSTATHAPLKLPSKLRTGASSPSSLSILNIFVSPVHLKAFAQVKGNSPANASITAS